MSRNIRNVKFNLVQRAAYELIQSDASFLYSLVFLNNEFKNKGVNFFLMFLPYMGIFADGAEQWCKKLYLTAPKFNAEEKNFYNAIRLNHKLFEKSYDEYSNLLIQEFCISDKYFFDISGFLGKIIGYNNVGVDLCSSFYCGNTILCSLYLPFNVFHTKNLDKILINMGIISGKLVAYFNCSESPVLTINKNICLDFCDFHFYNKCPLKLKSDLGFVLFSVLCSINYVIKFIDSIFIDEVPQKFKYAYLLYYYLCDFMKDLNYKNGTNFELNDDLINRDFRNCLAHYGLGQFMNESDVIPDDFLKGLTIKAFNLSYFEAKEKLFSYLTFLEVQIEREIF